MASDEGADPAPDTADGDGGRAGGGAGGDPAGAPKPCISPVALVSAAPLVALLAELEVDAERLRVWAPGSDASTALAEVTRRLGVALREAAEADVWVTTDEVARLRGLSRSAVTWRINNHRLKAEWRGGRWWVHRADVEAM